MSGDYRVKNLTFEALASYMANEPAQVKLRERLELST